MPTTAGRSSIPAGEKSLMFNNPSSGDYDLVVKQEPSRAKVFLGKEKDRKPIDPPPILQLKINPAKDPNQNYLSSPYYFVSCTLIVDDENSETSSRNEVKNVFAGNTCSSLHRLKDSDNRDGGFFVFGDLSVKIEGRFKLCFTLWELAETAVVYIKEVKSKPFTVLPSKNFPGMAESTFLTRSFSDQGVRLRLRKEPRLRLGARGPASDDYQPRHYNTDRRRQSQAESSQQHGSSYSQGSNTDQPSQPSAEFQSPQPVQPVQTSQVPPASSVYSNEPVPESLKRGYEGQYSEQQAYYGDDSGTKRVRPGHESSSEAYTQNYAVQPSQYESRAYTSVPVSSQASDIYGSDMPQSSTQYPVSRESVPSYYPSRRDYQMQASRPTAQHTQQPQAPQQSQHSQVGNYGYLPVQHQYAGLQTQQTYGPSITQQTLVHGRPSYSAMAVPQIPQESLNYAARSHPQDVSPAPQYGRMVQMPSSAQPSMSQLYPPANPGEDLRYPPTWSYEHRSRDMPPPR